MRILSIKKETIVDGDGLRYSIYVSGCNHKCKGCHNKDSWSFNQGAEMNLSLIKEIIEEINSNELLDGVTISGGDPLDPKNSGGLFLLLTEIKNKTNKNIWVYTGFKLEDVLSKGTKMQKDCLSLIDILVDGRFEESLMDLNLKYVGSSNQRILDLRKAGY